MAILINSYFFRSILMIPFLATSSVVSVSQAEPPNLVFVNQTDLIAENVEIDTLHTGFVDAEKSQTNYCLNILDEAKETRNAILTKRLKNLEKEVDEKLDLMEKRIVVLKSWTERREIFLSRANDSLVQIFQSMRPDAAASQLTEMGPAMSAPIISKLEPKYSSAILTEMKPADAAKVTMVLANLVGTDETN